MSIKRVLIDERSGDLFVEGTANFKYGSETIKKGYKAAKRKLRNATRGRSGGEYSYKRGNLKKDGLQKVNRMSNREKLGVAALVGAGGTGAAVTARKRRKKRNRFNPFSN